MHLVAGKGNRLRHWSRRALSSWQGRVVLIVVLILVGFRLALPSLLKRYVNKTLNKIPNYEGHVGDINVNLWRGGYQIRNVALVKTSGKVPVPFFWSPLVDLSIHWKALFHGTLAGEVIIDRPELNFVSAKSKEESQTEIDKSWTRRVKELFPLKINQCVVRDGQIHFRNFQSKPPVDIYLKQLQAYALNLANRPDSRRGTTSTVTAEAAAPGEGYLRFWATVDPFATKPTFIVDVALENVAMPALNDFFKAYANVDAQGGTFNMYCDVVSTNGVFHGYVKPMFNDLKILSMKDLKEKSILHVLWETLVAGVVELLKNQPKDRLATEIPLSGTVDDPNPDIWSTIWGILKNAYIQALVPGLNKAISDQPVAEKSSGS